MLKRDENTLVSSFCHVAHNYELEAVLRERYGRDGLCLKVFPKEWDKLEDVTWGKVPLEEATVIQNLFAAHDLAPRVYDLLWINSRQAAQVTGFLESDGQEPDRSGFLALMKRYNIKYRKCEDLAPRNWIGNKHVDFGGMIFKGREAYKQELKTQAYTRRGEMIHSAYQSVGELTIHGQRDAPSRIATMGLDEVDFRGRTVLDIGCNLGVFCRDAHDRGARRVAGIDHRDLPGQAQAISNLLGYWNLDFWELAMREGSNQEQIRQKTNREQHDIVYFMAIANYIGGYAPWVAGLCRDILYVEGHGGEQPGQYRAALQKDFRSVEFMGITKDNYRRPLFRCWKLY